MFLTYQNPVYGYVKSPDQDEGNTAHHPIIVVGAGPIGMGAAIDAGIHDLDVLVLDDNNTVSVGSRAVCYSKRALEILDRLGCAERMIDKGVTWNQSATTGPTEVWLYGTAIQPSHVDVDTVYIGGSGYGSPAVWKSTNGGQSFAPWGQGLPDTLVYCVSWLRV